MFLEVNNVNKTYETGNEPFQALKDISFSMEQGKICTIMGPSGSGKSTLLNIIGGIDHADSGNVLVDDVDITNLNDNKLTDFRKNSVGFIFQFYNLIPNLTVYENIEVTASINNNSMDINSILGIMGIQEFKNRFPKELSGGQQQRVSIARALVKKPSLLLCDEPTGSLDFSSAIEILKILTNINQEFNTTILIVTHNTAISGLAHKIIRLTDGEVSEDRINDNIIPAERIEW